MEGRFTPGMLVAYAAAQRGGRVEDFDVAPTVVLTWRPRVARSLAEAAGARMSPH